MTELRVLMNGVTGRMGHHQHLVRSVLAIRADGGVRLEDGTRVQLVPILAGRNENKLRALAAEHDIAEWTTDPLAVLDECDLYFDAQLTSARQAALTAAIDAGKPVFTEKPVAETLDAATDLAQRAKAKGIVNGVVHDKLYLLGLRKLRTVLDSGFFGRILSVRGEFGYWVFEGDLREAQRPSWNYRTEDGGGITLDMFAHWSYVLEGLFGTVESVTAKAITHIPRRWDEHGDAYSATADDAAYAIFELAGDIVAQFNSSWCVRVDRDELFQIQVDGTHGSAVAGLRGCRVQPRVLTPRPVWNPDIPDPLDHAQYWNEVPETEDEINGFRAQWEEFVRDLVAGRPHRFDLTSGARGVALAELGLRSSATGTRMAVPAP
jgi:predicted dehydrogenase